MFVNPKLNHAGQKILALFDEYHNVEATELQKESFMALAWNIIPRQQNLRTLFQQGNRDELIAAMLKVDVLRAELYDSICEAVDLWLYDNQCSFPHDFDHIKRAGNIFVIERRVALRATDIVKYSGLPLETIHSYFDEGVAYKMLEMMELKKVHSIAAEKIGNAKDLSVDVSVRSVRKYMVCLCVRFSIKFENAISSDGWLKKVASANDALTDYWATHPFLCDGL